MKTHTPPLVFLGMLGASLLVRCGGQVQTASTNGPATTQEAGVGTGGRGGIVFGGGGAAHGAGGVPGEAGATSTGGGISVPDTGAPQPPFLSPDHCTVAQDCPFPHSTCATATTLVYFTDPACSNGACEWRRTTLTCDRGCEAGGCNPSFTAPFGPGPPLPGAPCYENDAGGCPLPQSICGNNFQLLYFDAPHCFEGACAYTTHVRDCGQPGCINGACDILHAH